MNTTTGASPEDLRTRLVNQLITEDALRDPRVIQAMREVPRHRFLPAADLEEAYADETVITKRDGDGVALSCASMPSVVAMMLQQLGIQPGQRILEIGAGTGYNAALLAHLTGDDGLVTTVDIDPEVTAEASRALQATGYERVYVATRDGALGGAEHAPYDRIILTVGACDLPATWWEQLSVGGRLVVPLRWRGQARSVAFVRETDHLRADSIELCGFVPMIGQAGEREGIIDDDGHITLYWDADQTIAPASLNGVLTRLRAEAWSGVTVGPTDSFDGVWLRMTATEPGTCRVAADTTAVRSGLCTPAIPIRSPALAEGDSLAYFALRRLEDAERRSELGAIGHGPAGQQLADRLTRQIRSWNADRDAHPDLTAYPADTPNKRLPEGMALDKSSARLVLTLQAGS